MNCKINFVSSRNRFKSTTQGLLLVFVVISSIFIGLGDAASTIKNVAGASCTPDNKCLFNQGSSWTGGVVPTEIDDVIIDSNGASDFAFYISTDTKVASLTFVGGAISLVGSVLTVGNLLNNTLTVFVVNGGQISAPQWSIDGGEVYLNTTEINVASIVTTKNTVNFNGQVIGTQLPFTVSKLDMAATGNLELTGYNVAIAKGNVNLLTLNSCDGYIGSADQTTSITTLTITLDSTIKLSNTLGNKIITPNDGVVKQIFFANKVYFFSADMNLANVQVMQGSTYYADNVVTWSGSQSTMNIVGSVNISQQVGWYVMNIEMDDPSAQFSLQSSVLKGDLNANSGILTLYDASITGNVSLGSVSLQYPVTEKTLTLAQNFVTSSHTTINITQTIFKSKPHIIAIKKCALEGQLIFSFAENTYKLKSDQEHSYIDIIESQVPIDNNLHATIYRPSEIKSASLVTRNYNKLYFLSVRITNPEYVKNKNVGTLFGIIFGSIMGAALIVGITIFIIKKRKSMSNPPKDVEKHTDDMRLN